LARYREGHKWFFLGEQGRGEVLVMKIFDSQEGDRIGASCEFDFPFSFSFSFFGFRERVNDEEEGAEKGREIGGVKRWLADCYSLFTF
jgi:hypothetical protein